MALREFEKLYEHKHALIFVGGIAAGLIGKHIIESETTKKVAARGMAKVLMAKSEAEEAFQDMKDEAEDINVEAREIKKEKQV